MGIFSPSNINAKGTNDVRSFADLTSEISHETKGNFVLAIGNLYAGKYAPPASTIKVLTALLYLSSGASSPQIEYLIKENNLYIKSAIANLTSNDLLELAATIRTNGTTSINNIYFDISYLRERVVCTPGVIDNDDQRPLSAQYKRCVAHFNVDQNIGDRGQNPGKGGKDDYLAFIAQKVSDALIKAGIRVQNRNYQELPIPPSRSVQTFKEKMSISHKIKIMLRYSDNFFADQLLLLTGLQYNGETSLENAQSTCTELAIKRFGLHVGYIHYGGSGMSGASTKPKIVEGQRVNGKEMITLIQLFDKNYPGLLPPHRLDRKVRGKSGTLDENAGYVGIYNDVPFVVILDKVPKRTRDNLRRKAINQIKKIIDKARS